MTGPPADRPPRKIAPCPGCGAPVDCAMANGDAECWCEAYPPVLPVPPAGDAAQPAACYCPACLERLTGASPPPSSSP